MKRKKLFCNFAPNIEFIYDCSLKQIKNFIWRKHKIKFKEIDENINGQLFGVNDKNTSYRYVWVENKNNIPVLVHELIHLAVDILESRDIPINFENSEVLAYLVSDFYKQIKSQKTLN